MSCYCYNLECSDGTFYTGWSTDPQRRLKQHNSGHGAKYTRYRRPTHLVYVEELTNRSTAQQREFALKRLSRARKIELIKSYQRETIQ